LKTEGADRQSGNTPDSDRVQASSALIENKGKVLTHHYIMKQVWGYESSETKNVRVFMASLRRKIEKTQPAPNLF
jgi:DNA-binding response OmpR family regulator